MVRVEDQVNGLVDFWVEWWTHCSRSYALRLVWAGSEPLISRVLLNIVQQWLRVFAYLEFFICFHFAFILKFSSHFSFLSFSCHSRFVDLRISVLFWLLVLKMSNFSYVFLFLTILYTHGVSTHVRQSPPMPRGMANLIHRKNAQSSFCRDFQKLPCISETEYSYL